VVNRTGSDVELVLSYGSLRRATTGPYQVLDAGCGRGVGLLGGATLQPEVQWTGIDISRVSLEDARRQAEQRALRNVNFAEIDLMTLEGLEVPPGGFDVIHSSGVLHHLADPAQGLNRLVAVLAPHGMLNLMVYGRYGRGPLQHLSGAIASLFPDSTPLQDRLPVAREAATLAGQHALAGTRFADSGEVDDVELVDRLLNVNETSYDVPSVFSLLKDAGLRFLRWAEPADWDPQQLLPDGPLRQHLLTLDETTQWRFLEILFRSPGFEIIATHAANEPRPALGLADLPDARFRLNPEVLITTGVRHTPGDLRTETLSFTLRKREPVALSAGPIAAAILQLSKQPGARKGKQILRDLQKAGLSEPDAQAVMMELERHEVIFRLP